MDEFSDLTVEKFVGMIRGIVRDVLKTEMSKAHIEKYYNGIVKSVNTDNNTATIDIGDKLLDDIPNKTGLVLGETLIEKDTVRVYSSSATLTDAYIGVKLN